VKLRLSESFRPVLLDEHRYLVMVGGRGSGKSETAGRKVFFRAMAEGHHRYLIMRKIRKTLEQSVIRVMRSILAENDIPHAYNKSERIITFAGPRGTSEFVFEGMDDPEKIKSIKGITSVWLEEATEFSEEEFINIDLCLREPGPGYKQLILTFNPDESKARWLKDRFFGAVPADDAFVHRSTVDDNPIAEVRAEYTRTLDALRHQDEAIWRISRLGEWAARMGQVYAWDVVPLPKDTGFDEVWYGGDFGYSVDPAAIVRIHRKADEFWLEEILYRRGLTNQMLAAEMRAAGIGGDDIVYFDSAEPKSIDELRHAGLNVRPAEKGPDSVRSGIDFIKSLKVHIVEGSVNLVNEASGYCWRKDRSGTVLPEPVKFDDHLMDAVRYGIYTHVGRQRQVRVLEF
jgi:phage terminase large subunit